MSPMSDRRHFIPQCQQIDKDSRNESPRPGATHCLLCRERQEVQPIRDGVIKQDSRLRQAEETEFDTRFLHHRQRWGSQVVRIDTSISDVTECVAGNVDESEFLLHVARHTERFQWKMFVVFLVWVWGRIWIELQISYFYDTVKIWEYD